ncbi:MAG: LysM peptidoglycan-binding domain-containing protein, partial [Planctomycetaceae bacterium]|nr:LysM peptidoglycan-binding domain-containing protein [Planctomycetaceae bacterium]
KEPQAAAAPSLDVPAAVLKQPPTPESPEFLPAKPLPADDPFLASEPGPAATARTTETDFNASRTQLTPPAASEVPLDVPETPRRIEPTPPSTPAMSVPRSAALPVEPDPFGDTPREVELPAQPQVPLPTGETPPPMLVTTARVPSPAVRPAINTGAYVVQPGDDFWKISKQVYGTGRYFQALAKHNAATVADPGRMQPGTRVATPPAQQLDALYKAEIPLGEAPQVQALRQTHPDRYAPDAQPGFFIDRSGQPMYRIGSSDTLSAIAKNHLGRSSRWQQIFAMNRDILKDGNTLSVGAILKLPADASQVQMVGFDQQNR